MKLASKILEAMKPLDKALKNFNPKKMSKAEIEKTKLDIEAKNKERLSKVPKADIQPTKYNHNSHLLYGVLALQNTAPVRQGDEEIYKSNNRHVVINHKNKTMNIISLGTNDRLQAMKIAKQLNYRVVG